MAWHCIQPRAWIAFSLALQSNNPPNASSHELIKQVVNLRGANKRMNCAIWLRYTKFPCSRIVSMPVFTHIPWSWLHSHAISVNPREHSDTSRHSCWQFFPRLSCSVGFFHLSRTASILQLSGCGGGKSRVTGSRKKDCSIRSPVCNVSLEVCPCVFGNNRLCVWWGEHDYWTFVSFSFRAEWHRCRRIRSTFVVPLGFISFFLNWDKSVSCLPSFTGGSPSVEAGIWFHLFLSSLLRAHHTLFQNCCSPIFISLFSFFTYCHSLPVFTFFFLCLPHLSFFSSIYYYSSVICYLTLCRLPSLFCWLNIYISSKWFCTIILINTFFKLLL